jgi:putative endonuclease
MKGSWFVYLVKCVDGSLYCGISNDVEARITTHNAGKGSKYTRSRLPVELVYKEPQTDKIAAMQREYVVKSMHRSIKLKLIEEANNGQRNT